MSIVANLSITAVEGHYQAYRRIIIEDDHQTVSHGTRLLEVLHVPYVQEIKQPFVKTIRSPRWR